MNQHHVNQPYQASVEILNDTKKKVHEVITLDESGDERENIKK